MNEKTAGEATRLTQLLIRGCALFRRSGVAASVGNHIVGLAARVRVFAGRIQGEFS